MCPHCLGVNSATMPASLASTLYAAYARERGPECKVCQARPNADGERIHGKGCYMLSEDGGGSDWPYVPTLAEQDEDTRAAWERVAEVARDQLAPMPVFQVPPGMTLADVARAVDKLNVDSARSLVLESATCEEPIPCGQCDTCHAEAKRDNAAREQPPAFEGTVDELDAKLTVDVHCQSSAVVDAVREGQERFQVAALASAIEAFGAKGTVFKIVLGLLLLARKGGRFDGAEHDEIFAGDGVEFEKLTDAEREALYDHGWRYRDGGWARFV